MGQLDGRVILITGAAGGIGTAVARTTAAEGARVIVHDLSLRALADLAAGIGSAASVIAADLSDAEDSARLWRDALAVHGRVDVLVNNAGIYPPAPLEQPLEEWIDVWSASQSVNLLAPAILCREAVKTYVAQDGGGILINLASRAAFRGEDPEYWHYAAAKAGVVAMTRTIARHYGRQGVTAFTIAPGYVDTSFNQVFKDTIGVQVAAEQTGLGEVAQPQDIANVIAFLATGLAKHATGTTIDVNGASYVR